MCSDNCAVHSRSDARDAVESNMPLRLVNYLGKYAVVTIDNPDFMNPALALSAIFGDKPLPPMFVTMVLEVGEEGTLSDVTGSADALKAADKFRQTHTELPEDFADQFDDYDTFVDESNKYLTEKVWTAHDMVVEGVTNGTLVGSEA